MKTLSCVRCGHVFHYEDWMIDPVIPKKGFLCHGCQTADKKRYQEYRKELKKRK